jgi:hypothetical protein
MFTDPFILPFFSSYFFGVGREHDIMLQAYTLPTSELLSSSWSAFSISCCSGCLQSISLHYVLFIFIILGYLCCGGSARGRQSQENVDLRPVDPSLSIPKPERDPWSGRDGLVGQGALGRSRSKASLNQNWAVALLEESIR